MARGRCSVNGGQYNGHLTHHREHAVDFRGLLDAWRTGGSSPRTSAEYAVRLPLDGFTIRPDELRGEFYLYGLTETGAASLQIRDLRLE